MKQETITFKGKDNGDIHKAAQFISQKVGVAPARIEAKLFGRGQYIYKVQGVIFIRAEVFNVASAADDGVQVWYYDTDEFYDNL